MVVTPTFTHTSKTHLINYTTTVRKMLSLVETLQGKFRTIILDCCIANMDHILHTRTFQHIKCQIVPYFFKKRPHY